MKNSQFDFTQNNPYIYRSPRFKQSPLIGKILLFVVLHIVLALLMRFFSFISTLHALVVFVIAIWTVLRENDLRKLIPITAYIVSSEVLWRMTGANIFWEFGKYAIIAIMVLALLKFRRVKKAGLPVLFFVLLLPSISFTIDDLGFSARAREFISFNLSGPLAASICLIFFLQIKTKLTDLKDWVWPMVYPIFGILTLAIYSTLTATSIDFGTELIFVTSGGFGPNQVSAILGLGALILVMYAMTEKQKARGFALLAALALLTQSFLTFSRGGLYNFAVGLGLAVLHLLRKPDRFMRGVIIVVIIGIAAGFVIIPWLDDISGGMLVRRYTDVDLSSREALANADIDLFLKNPVLGVGPGMGFYLREGVRMASAHTEYTRLLSEHGSLWDPGTGDFSHFID